MSAFEVHLEAFVNVECSEIDGENLINDAIDHLSSLISINSACLPMFREWKEETAHNYFAATLRAHHQQVSRFPFWGLALIAGQSIQHQINPISIDSQE